MILPDFNSAICLTLGFLYIGTLLDTRDFELTNKHVIIIGNSEQRLPFRWTELTLKKYLPLKHLMCEARIYGASPGCKQ